MQVFYFNFDLFLKSNILGAIEILFTLLIAYSCTFYFLYGGVSFP